MAFFFSGFAHFAGHGSDQAITQENSEEGSHQSSRHLVSNFFRGPADSAHRDYNSEHGGDNSQARQRVGYSVQRVSRLVGVVVMDLHVQFHDLIQFERRRTAGHRH